ncbi:MAG TPA: type 4a pilus biogenesis protein PilO [Candidatus Pacearchaeota archaeon]|nr:type 4a pilus biogenesis protein PilO [Candidatus Pacearchaeota archaeon]
MIANTKNQKIIFLICLSGIIMILVLGFGVPKIKAINRIVGDISDKIGEIRTIEVAKTQTKELQEEKEKYKDDFGENSAKKMFLDINEYKNFINSLYDLAEKNGLECKINYSGDNFSKEKIKEGQNPYIIISLETSGSYNDSYKFLNKIENYPYLVDILDFKISKNKDQGVLSNFSIKVYATPKF